MKIRAAVINEANTDYVLEDLILSEIQEDEILIKMVASGICHSDDVLRTGTSPYPLPVVLGHEGSGIVEKVGRQVTEFQPGDHVVLSYKYCGHCEHCLTGVPASCESWRTLNWAGSRSDGTYMFHKEDGTPVNRFFSQSSFSTHAIVNECNITKVDPTIDLRLIAPLGCGFLTGSGTVINGLKPEPGSTIAVFGTGSVGLAAMMAGKIAGCTKVIGIDIHHNRLEIAKELGATHIINSKEQDVIEEIKKITNNKGVNYAVDTTGVITVIKTALASLANGGVLAPIAAAQGEININTWSELSAFNRSIKGVLMGNAVPQFSIPKLIEFYQAGSFPIDKLIKFYNFSDINQANRDSLSGETIKPVLIIDENYKPTH